MRTSWADGSWMAVRPGPEAEAPNLQLTITYGDGCGADFGRFSYNPGPRV
jgi:hypothetical protein